MKEHQFQNILRLLKLTGGKYIIVEDGEPRAVLMGYNEFEELAAPAYTQKLLDRAEEINKKITDAQLNDFQGSLLEEVISEEEPTEELRIEPLDPI